MENKKIVQVLISTMNLEMDSQVDKLLKQMNINTDYIIVNQVKDEKRVTIHKENVLTVEQYGLSRSRNLALATTSSDIVMLADDDLRYVDGYDAIVKKAYSQHPKVDIICFFVESKNKARKVKKPLFSKVGYINTMRICSFQISMKRSSVKDIMFDERFGSGSRYNRGEENIFLCDCLRKGLKIKFVNQKIGEVEQKRSSWFHGFSKEYFEVQGKIFRRMYPRFYYVAILQFAIRKHRDYKSQVSFKEAWKLMKEQ